MLPTITLKVVEGPHAGQEMACTDRVQITIGRSRECNFSLHGEAEDLMVSRRHCLIDVHPDWVEIRDLESRNGTYINGARIGFPLNGQPDGSTAFKRRLKGGDRIRIGASIFQVDIRQPLADTMPMEEAEFCPASFTAT
jgi:pSer/pThr/pTyr-binding forkhead associated (FHA) protein